MSGDSPTTLQDMQRKLTDMENRVSLLEQGRGLVHFKEPQRPRDGTQVFADGVTWNPGAGPGYYEYHTGAWHKL